MTLSVSVTGVYTQSEDDDVSEGSLALLCRAPCDAVSSKTTCDDIQRNTRKAETS